MAENKINNTKVCVTGGAGYIGSWLVKKLLLKGYFVHATLRDLNDSSKVDLLKALPYAQERLLLLEADIYNPDTFESAILGCEFVFHLATPMQHTTSKFKNTSEAGMAGMNSILESCVRSKTVKRVIYTASVMSASPLKEDGTSFKNVFDESCWTPLHHKFSCMDDFALSYVTSKTLVEKEVLKYNDKEKYGLDVVSLVCGLVGGDAILPYMSSSQETIISDLKTNSPYKYLNLFQEMLGSIPLAHIDDICEAHIYCMEKLSTNGRILCAQAYLTRTGIADYYRENFPEFIVDGEALKENGRGVESRSTKLVEYGFEFKYDVKKMLDDTVKSARRLGSI